MNEINVHILIIITFYNMKKSGKDRGKYVESSIHTVRISRLIWYEDNFGTFSGLEWGNLYFLCTFLLSHVETYER